MHYSLALIRDWRLGTFCLALFLYALWGSPTPNNPDWVEITIALLLILSISLQGISSRFLIFKNEREEYWIIFAKIFFLYGISIPLIVAAVHGENISVILRDMIAFIFLCLPIFLYEFLKNKGAENIFLVMCLIIGLIFAVRVLVPHFLLFRNTTELLYLANSPLVLMTTILLLGVAAHHSFQKINLNHILKIILFVGLATLPLMAMFVDLQRASFLALVISALSLGIIGFVKAPNKMVMPSLLIIICFLVFENYFLNLVEGVNLKTAQVGFNMREQELLAVWNMMSQNTISLFLGQGWGSYFTSPAVGNLNVTYTHSLLSYIFLKTGLIGLCLCLVYLYFIFEKWLRLYCSNPVKGNALIWPFIIPIFLYASHKSFDYGLLLTLILVLSTRKQVVKA